MVDKSLLKNKYDYQILARQSIFKTSVASLVKDIERCLKGEAIAGIPEKPINAKKKKNKNNKVKTCDVLNAKLE